MTEAVTDVIVSRARTADGLRGTVGWSVALHVAFVGLALALPDPAPEPPRTVMMISLGGAPGPDVGGATTAGGRAVQATPPPEEPVRRVETPPAPKPPPMTVPPPQAKPRPPQPKPQQAPREAAGRTPSTGEEPREGSTRAETGARGQGFGLSTTGGGGVGGVRVASDFCCPDYLEDMVRRIRQNWQDRHGLVGSTMMQFTIGRDGTIHDVRVERSSGFVVLDQASQSALLRTQRLPPLPAAYPHPTLAVGLRFDYQR